MTPAEILRKIVEADKNAREVYDSTAELRDGFDGYVAEHVEGLRKEYYEKAEKRIADADREAIAKADKAIEASDEKLKKELAAAKDLYIGEKDAVIDKIFHMAVDVNA